LNALRSIHPRHGTPARRRLFQALAFLLGVILSGGIIYYALGWGRWSLEECIYMSVITVSTVGFAELRGFDDVRFAREFTGILIVAGIGGIAYFQSTLTAFLVEGTIGQAWRRTRMKKQIEALSQHVVVAGVGSTGRHVIEELRATSTPLVAIDRNREHLERVNVELGGNLLHIHGDATNDEILREAGVDRAAGVVTTLNDDKANLFVTLSARSMNASARIVARVIEPETTAKMARAGADITVSPNMIGGRRMAHELVRPEVAAFFDEMMRSRQSLRLEEIALGRDSAYANHAIVDLPSRDRADVMVLAVKDGSTLRYNPSPSLNLAEGCTLVVLGEPSEVDKFRQLVGE
jgi:voltage-gated potassium channel